MIHPEQQPVLANAANPDTLFVMPPALPPEPETTAPGRFHLNLESIGKRVAAVALGVAVTSGILSIYETAPAHAEEHSAAVVHPTAEHVSAKHVAPRREVSHREMVSMLGDKFKAAHRSDLNGLDVKGARYAENTIPNEKAAIRFFKKQHHKHPSWSLSKFVLESDWQFTSDNIPVDFHDTTLQRLTNCTGTIASKTYAQLSHCVVNIAKVKSHIPTLDHYLSHVAPTGFSIYPEFKQLNTTPAQEQIFANTLSKYGMNNNRTTVQSFYSGNLKEWVKIAPNVPAAQLQHKLKNPEAVSEYAQYVFLDVSHASNADIRRAVAAKLRVVTWTDDTTSQLRKAIENPNVAGFITNETADLAKF